MGIVPKERPDSVNLGKTKSEIAEIRWKRVEGNWGGYLYLGIWRLQMKKSFVGVAIRPPGVGGCGNADAAHLGAATQYHF